MAGQAATLGGGATLNALESIIFSLLFYILLIIYDLEGFVNTYSYVVKLKKPATRPTTADTAR